MSVFEKTFNQEGTFQAWYAAQDWLNTNGYSYGSSCRGQPVGVLRGDFLIAKWKNLTPKERNSLDGQVNGDFREGPVTINLKHIPKEIVFAVDSEGGNCD